MRTLLLLLLPALLPAAPRLVGQKALTHDAYHFTSPGRLFQAVVEFETGNSEFVPFSRFELRDAAGGLVYAKDQPGHTVLDVADNGIVVGIDFDGPISGRARLHFYDATGVEQGTADIGFLNRRAFSADGGTYCVNDGVNGLRVFSVRGSELHNLGPCNTFAVSPDGRRIALAQDDAIRLYTDGVETERIPLAAPLLRALSFSPTGDAFGYASRRELRVRRDGSEFAFTPADPALNIISLDLGADRILLGTDRDAGRGSLDRHRRGMVYLLDYAGKVADEHEVRYPAWNIEVPGVRFQAGQSYRVRLVDEELEYRY